VVHGADKDLLATLLVFATSASAIALLLLTVSIFLIEAVLGGRFLLLALMAVITVAAVALLRLLGWLVALSVGLRVLFAAFAAAATPAALPASITIL
jgi:hypothetical protein